MTDYDDVDEDTIPMSVKSELYRLSSVLDMDSADVQSERDCVRLIGTAIRSIERLKSEQSSGGGRPGTTADGSSRQEKKIAAKAKAIEDDLRISLKTFDDAGTLKAKVSQLQGQLRKEREQRVVFEKFIESQNKKIMILITHVDKLMKALKRESGKTIKALEGNRLLEKEVFTQSQKMEKQGKVIAVQNRYVSEIAEGSRILQDQLALMDERYLELRNRLESSRKLFSTQMTRIQKESSELRVKYSMATHGKLLDTVPLPSQYELSLIAGGMEGAFRGSVDTAELLQRSGTAKKGKPRAASARAALSSSSRNATGNLQPLQTIQGSSNNLMGRPGSPGSPGGRSNGIARNYSEESHPADGVDYKERAQQMFVRGLTHNTQYAPALSAAEAEVKEKTIVKKITDKVNKGDAERWTDEKLHSLVKGSV